MNAYAILFAASYGVVGFQVLSNFLRKNNRTAALRGNPNSQAVKHYRRTVWRNCFFVVVWPTFVFGSVLGLITSLIYRIAS